MGVAIDLSKQQQEQKSCDLILIGSSVNPMYNIHIIQVYEDHIMYIAQYGQWLTVQFQEGRILGDIYHSIYE